MAATVSGHGDVAVGGAVAPARLLGQKQLGLGEQRGRILGIAARVEGLCGVREGGGFLAIRAVAAILLDRGGELSRFGEFTGAVQVGHHRL